MTKMPLKKTIAVSSPSPGHLIVAVRFKNLSNFDLFVLKDEPFVYVTSGTTEIDDIGPTVKRKPYTLADYERLAPEQTIEKSRDIAAQFDWLSGTHVYTVSVSGDYEDPVNGEKWKGSRVSATFSWTK
jgi:hypothetical protein